MTTIKWLPGSESQFMVAFQDGSIVMMDKDKDDNAFTTPTPPDEYRYRPILFLSLLFTSHLLYKYPKSLVEYSCRFFCFTFILASTRRNRNMEDTTQSHIGTSPGSRSTRLHSRQTCNTSQLWRRMASSGLLISGTNG